MADRREKAVATANTYQQGDIAGLDDAMTRRLVASTVMTESRGGDLAITNGQGYVGRYQAGAGWLADAGYVDKSKLMEAMKQDGFNPETTKGAEWKWAVSGGMTRFLEDRSNWKDGMSLDQYKGSADLQDKAFKINSDKAYHQAIKEGVLKEEDSPEKVAGFLKARHIAGYGGARAAVTGGRVIRDSNGTSNYDYMHDITRNRDGLDQYMGREPGQQPQPGEERTSPASGGVLREHDKGAGVRELQEQLNQLGYRDAQGKPLSPDGDFGDRTRQALLAFQQTYGLKADGIVGPQTLEALKKAEQEPLLSNPNHRDHALYKQSYDELKKLDPATLGFASDRDYQNAAASIAFEARVSGIKQVDHVVSSANGAGLIVVQGELNDPAHSRLYVDKAQAAAQPLEQSTGQLQQEMQRQPQPSQQQQQIDQQQRDQARVMVA